MFFDYNTIGNPKFQAIFLNYADCNQLYLVTHLITAL